MLVHRQQVARAVLDDSAPLQAWLEEQNRKLGYKTGW
jgi:hypothetical protein